MTDETSGATGDSGSFDVAQAAAEVADRRVRETPVDPIIDQAKRETIKPEDAAYELTNYRRHAGVEFEIPVTDRTYPTDEYGETQDRFRERTAIQAARELADARAAEGAKLREELARELDGAQAAQQSAEQQAAPEQQQAASPTPEGPVQWVNEINGEISDLLTKSNELIVSDKPEERAAGVENMRQVAQRIADVMGRTNEYVAESNKQWTGQVTQYATRVVQNHEQSAALFQNVVGAILTAEYGSIDPNQLAQTNPAAYRRMIEMTEVYRGLEQQRVDAASRVQAASRAVWSQWAADEDKKAFAAIPDANELRDELPRVLTDTYSFTPQELAAAYHGQQAFSMRDARVQRVLADAAKYQRSQRAVASVQHKLAKNPVPQVQRPGTAGQRAYIEQIQDHRTLESRLGRTGSVQDATALLLARRARQR